eukprot:5211342-Amphidinium_carterae.4
MELTAMAHSLLQEGAVFNLPIFREYVLKKLAPVTVSRSWCYKFLVGIGLRQAKLLRVSDKKQFTPAQKQELNDAHRRRVRWTCREKSIERGRIYNMDESSVELIPTQCSAFGKDHPVPGDGKMPVTVSVALTLGETMPVFSQNLFKREAARIFLQTTHLRTCVLTTALAVADSQHVAAVDGLHSSQDWRLSLDVVAGRRAHPYQLRKCGSAIAETQEVVAVEDGAGEEGKETDECDVEDVHQQAEDAVEDVWAGYEPAAQVEHVQACPAADVQAKDARTLSRFVAL